MKLTATLTAFDSNVDSNGLDKGGQIGDNWETLSGITPMDSAFSDAHWGTS